MRIGEVFSSITCFHKKVSEKIVALKEQSTKSNMARKFPWKLVLAAGS